MPPKRRKASVDRDDDPSPTSTPAIKRRKKTALNYDPMEFCQELYDTIRNHKTEDGRLLCESFIRVPKRRTDPEYYDIVTQPIDLLKIQHKLRNEEYDEMDQLTQDIELMVNNAKAFYSENDDKTTSQEYQDACDLWDLYEDTKNLLMAEVFGEAEKSADAESAMDTDRERRTKAVTQDDRSSVMTEENNDTDPILEEMFAAVVTAKDGPRKVSEMFTVLPSKTRYPEYYELTKEPIDIRTIAQRIQSNSYPTLDDLVGDFMLMINNAKSFNEPGSKIYKDANMLKKIISSKKIELDSRSGRKTSARVRNRRSMHEVKKLSAEIAALEVEDVAELPPPKTPASSRRGRKPKMVLSADEASSDDEDEDDDENDEEDEEGEEEDDDEETDDEDEGKYKGNKSLYYELFNALKTYKVDGRSAIDPFVRLPNRRFFPAYYEEIKRPMSVSNISKKLKNNSYSSIDRMIADFELVFNNAQQSSLANTKYKDARKLQAHLRQKVEELKRDHPEELENNSAIDIRATPITKHARASMEPGSDGEGTPRDRAKPGRKALSPEDALYKRLNLLFDHLYNLEGVEGRELILIFLELPPKKIYPDYYQVIAKPIDMGMIEAKIKNKQYGSEHQLLQDFELMFSNAKHYNEEGSRVYKDAVTLERALKKKLQSLKPLGDSPVRTGKPGRPGRKSGVNGGSPLGQKLHELYNTIIEYKDNRGRVLSSPFVVLPSKSDYPDYYDVIKKPIDMDRMRGQMNTNKYSSVEDMVQDFLLMFDNACKYNEPDSLIYKDALTLQRVCLEKKQDLVLDDGSEIPDVRAGVLELMTSIYVATYNHADEDGRCYSDSFQDMPNPPNPPKPAEGETDSAAAAIIKKPTFETIKRNLDKGRYRRVDRFQEDMFEVFKYARSVSRTDSQLYEDSADLQKFFIQTREQLCKNGEVLLTPALSYQEVHLLRDLEMERREKLPVEMKEDEEKKKQQAEEDAKKEEQQPKDGKLETIEHKGETYQVGDFVYVEPRFKRKRGRPSLREKDIEPHIVCIERMWRDENGEALLYGCWLYRPQETYHAASRKFLEQEVFKSDFYEAATFSRVMRKCFVMPVKDYYKMKPEGFDDKHVYVCESRYNSKHKAFKKMKIWQMPKNESSKIVARDIPLVPNRVASVFKQKQTTAHSETSEDDGETQVIEKIRENVPIVERKREEGEEDHGYTYYEQAKTPAGWLKLGDCVYVRSDEDKPYIALIEKLWMDKSGDMFFHGPWYVHPSDVDHQPNRLFYKNEVFKSSIEDTNPVLSIQGRCAVMTFKDYCISRPTEVPEIDVYVCECKYVESEKLIRKITKTVPKRPYNSLKVLDDEILFFKKSISPQKEMSPLAAQSDDIYSEATDDVSMSGTNVSITDGGFPSFGIGESFNQDDSNFSTASQPKSEKKKIYYYKDRQRKIVAHFYVDSKSGKAWQPSGYMVYSSENRKRISDENPDLTFGEISRAVGQKWRELNKEDKNRYEEKAKKLAEENAAKQAEAERAFNDSLSMFPPSCSPMMDRSMSPGMSGRPGTPGSHHFASNQGYMQPNAYPPAQHMGPSGGHYPNQYHHHQGAPVQQPYYGHHMGGGAPGGVPHPQGPVPHGMGPYPPGAPPPPPHPHMAPPHHNQGMMSSPHAGSVGSTPRPNYQQIPGAQQIQFASAQQQQGSETSLSVDVMNVGPNKVKNRTTDPLYQPRPTKRVALKPVRYREEFESYVSTQKRKRGESAPTIILKRPYVFTAQEESSVLGQEVQMTQVSTNSPTPDLVEQKGRRTAEAHPTSVDQGDGSKVMRYQFGIGTLNSQFLDTAETFRPVTPASVVATPPSRSGMVSIIKNSALNQNRPQTTDAPMGMEHQYRYWGYPPQAEAYLPHNYFYHTGPIAGAPVLVQPYQAAPPPPPGIHMLSSSNAAVAHSPSFMPVHNRITRMQPMQQAAQAPQVPQRPPSPMFVSVPPRTQRLLHSEAYLRYIEGLHPDNPNISNWERQLTATKENTPLDKNAKLPTQWLANGSGHHENTVSALWALRDLMTKDALMVSRTLEFSQL